VLSECDINHIITDAENNWQDLYKIKDAQFPVPFPYVMTCLMVGASFDPQERYNCAMPHVEPFGMPFDKGDNNDGITVIDISDLNTVKYCFVFLDSSEIGQLETNTPLTGQKYVCAYLQQNDNEEDDEENSDEESADGDVTEWVKDSTGRWMSVHKQQTDVDELIENRVTPDDDTDADDTDDDALMEAALEADGTKTMDVTLDDMQILNSVWPDFNCPTPV